MLVDHAGWRSIFLLNVPGVSENAAKNLEGFVRDGGGLGVFLGENVRSADYNKILNAMMHAGELMRRS